MSAYKPSTEEYKTLADIVRAVDIPEPTVRSHAKKGLINIIKQDDRFYVSQEEFDRIVNSYNTRGFVLPVEYEGWRIVEEMSKEIGKNKFAIWRYLDLGYLKGTKVRLKGRNGGWVIEPASYNAFVARYKEAHSHLENWHTVKEYAVAIGLSPMWVRELIRMGRIEADKITRREAMLVTKDEHTYRIPSPEMERARQVGQLINIGKVLEVFEVEGRRFSRQYFLYDIFPALGIGKVNAPTRKARISRDDIGKIVKYILANSDDLAFIAKNKTIIEYNIRVRLSKLDTTVLALPHPTLEDRSSLENERKLWLLVKQGNEDAFKLLIQTYMPYITKTAYYTGSNNDIESKIARGIYGLWVAIMRVVEPDDRMRGYAKRHIKGKIQHLIRDDKGRKTRKTFSLETPDDKGMTLGEKLGAI